MPAAQRELAFAESQRAQLHQARPSQLREALEQLLEPLALRFFVLGEAIEGLEGLRLAVLQDAQLDSAKKRQRIEDIAYGAIDFPTLSKLVLARNWSKWCRRNDAVSGWVGKYRTSTLCA